MSTVDIPRANGNALAAFTGADDNLARLGQWVEAARNAHQLVAPLVGTAFVPDAYRPKIDPRATQEERSAAVAAAVANATAAVLYGLSLGIDPLMALQQIYVVHGRPGMYAKMMVALVQSQGHEVWTEDLTDSRAVVCGRRKGSQHLERITITMDMARRAKWATTNSKYTETPQDMLWARAAGRVCDRIASDVLKGIATVEQIEDETVMATATAGPAVRTVTPRRRPEAAAITPAEEPPLEPVLPSAQDLAMRARHDYDPTEDEPLAKDIGDAPEAMTTAQGRKLFALLRKTGREDKELALDRIGEILGGGRIITSTKELSKAEAVIVIDALEAEDKVPTEPDPWDVAAEAEQPELV